MHPDIARLMHDGSFREIAELEAHGAPSTARPPRRSLRQRLALRLVRAPRARTGSPVLTIRQADARDEPAVARLAELDDRVVPEGRLLVAEVDREIVAAAPLTGEASVANPFVATADVVLLLELRARQLAA
jgi:hypothetical protein